MSIQKYIGEIRLAIIFFFAPRMFERARQVHFLRLDLIELLPLPFRCITQSI